MKVYLKTRAGKWILVKGWLKQVSTRSGKRTQGYALLGEETDPPEVEGGEELIIPASGFSRLLSKVVNAGEGVVVVEQVDTEHLRVRGKSEAVRRVAEIARELKIVE
ncbi:hypothetical protein [Thermogladius sp.]|jgi:hypothetical protein|uniref:hypothetical protein n=1 Tax=Thermogladius sp. TaxID=2023064 RepID=UPI003D10D7CE